MSTPTEPERRAGILSVEVAARLLQALCEAPSALALKDLAAAADMPMSKAHRYLVSLGRAGLVEQDSLSGRYDLGRLALTMGLTAMGRMDIVRSASETLSALRDRVQETTVLAVWGENGATVIRFEESANPVRMNVKVGSVLPVTRSSIGQTFAAYLPGDTTSPVIATERARQGRAAQKDAEYRKELKALREIGMCRNVGVYIPGVSAIAAPVFDHSGRIVAVIGVLGHEPSLDTAWDGPVASALREAVEDLSKRLGHTG